MGSDGGGGSFFHLFDWNKKSRKKLFRDDVCSEKTIQREKGDDNVPTTQFHPTDHDRFEKLANSRVSSHYTGALVNDQEENVFKNPGVVARLMGLDYIPAPENSEPNTAALRDLHTLLGDCSKKKVVEKANDNFYHVSTRRNIYSGKPEPKFHQTPNSPIERFQVEALPPRVNKTISIVHHKLLSPVKNPGFISPRNASYIIEAAAKILESELHGGTVGRVHSFKSPLNFSKEHDPSGIIAIPRKLSTLLESSEENTKKGDTSSFRAQNSSGSLKGIRDSTVNRSLLATNGSTHSGTKSEQRSVPPGNKAKLNTHRRDGLNMKIASTVEMNDNDSCSFNKPVKILSNDRKNNQHNKKAVATNGSCVLKQKNQKQSNLSDKSKSTLQPSVSEQKGMKSVHGDVSSDKNKTVKKLTGNTKVCLVKKGRATADLNRDGLPDYRNFTQRKALVEQSSFSPTSMSSDEIPPDRLGKLVQHNVMMNESSRWYGTNTQRGTDVVSFTFTSPIRKPVAGSLSSSHEVEKEDKNDRYASNTYRVVADSENDVCSLPRFNVTEDDCLGVIVERKLHQLSSGSRSPYKLSKGDSFSTDTSVSEGSTSCQSTFSAAEHQTESIVRSYDSLASEQSESMSYMPQEVNKVECDRSNVDEGRGHQDESPFSCYSSVESWKNVHGSKLGSSSSFIQAVELLDWNCRSNTLSATPEIRLSDTYSPILRNRDGEIASEVSTSGHTKSCSQELSYVKEIITNTGFTFENLIPCPVDHSFAILDPVLFDKLEETRASTLYDEEEKQLKMMRKMLFDSVNECLDTRCSLYFRAGYRSWVKGVTIVAKELAEELYKEISGWSSIGDWLVDELVDEDMSTHLGSWIHYEIEAFEAGLEIEGGVFSYLVDEALAEYL